jgi:tetratricopeptide (TPR) repeat protein
MNFLKITAAVFTIALVAAMATGRAEEHEKTLANEKMAELFELSFAHEIKGKPDQALSDVRKILARDKNHYIANLRAGWLAYLNAKYSESIRYYKKATRIAPNAVEPLLGLMLPMMASRMWTDAEKIGGQVLKRAPANYLAGSRLAYIYFSQGRYAKAETEYIKVLGNFPSEVEMMLGLGWTYLRQGKKAEARKMFEQALSIRRKNLNARAGLDTL